MWGEGVNVAGSGHGPVPAALWEQREMRLALAARNLTVVYRLLQRRGVSQRRIAALTAQAPSEVHEILNGRQVMAYDVLARVADGLGVPRGYLGLAYDESTNRALDTVAATCSTAEDEREEVRALLAQAAQVTMGAAVEEIAMWWQPLDRESTPVPQRIGVADVDRVEAVTAVLRALDYRFGGGSCRDAVTAHVRWAQQLLTAGQDGTTRSRLHLALADLHNLAGWVCFDVGLYQPGRRHLGRALEQAKQAGDASLVANVLYRMGRLHLHRGWFRDALRFYQLGQIAAQDSGCELTVAMLCANEAWAYALMGDAVQADKSIGRARDEFTRADPTNARGWVRFFTIADLHASAGMVHLALTARRKDAAALAIDSLNLARTARGPEMTRSQVFELTALATAHLHAGNSADAVRAGDQVIALATAVRSVRVLDRLEPLHQAATAHASASAQVRDLAERIATLRST